MRRNRRRKRRPFERLRRGLTAVLAGVIAPAAGVASLAVVAQWAGGHSYFRIRDVEIEGARDPDVVLEWARVAPGMSLWSVDPGAVARSLLERGRIRVAVVRREFPDRLRIRVEERRPIAVLLLDEPFLMDVEGRLFPPLRSEMLDDYPYVTGFRQDDVAERPAWLGARLRQAAKVLQAWQRHPDWPPISEVRPDARGEIVVHPERLPMAIRFGLEIDDEQFVRLAAVMDLWRGREAQVVAVDLSVPGQAVLRLREGEKPSLGRMTI